MIIDRLIGAITEKKAPIVAGLDPRLELVPAHVKNPSFDRHGKAPEGVAEAFLNFNKEVIDAIYDIIPAVKLQFAMYEQYGSAGITAYIDTVKHAKSYGLIVIGDVKRSDIASSAEAYSDGHIGRVNICDNSFEVFDEDFITISPYLGSDSVEPFLENCKKYDRGLFVLVKTSNPGSGELQDIRTDNGDPLYMRVGELVSKWGADMRGGFGYSNVGAVVGATYPSESLKIREKFPNLFFLVPGYGAQGATASDLKPCFDKSNLGAIINNSRGIIAAYKSPKYKESFTELEFAAASRKAVIEMRDDLNAAIGGAV